MTEQHPNPSGIPDFLQDEASIAAIERGRALANMYMEHPELQTMPTQKAMHDAGNEVVEIPRATIGSRAKHGPLSEVVTPVVDVSAEFGNPEGRSAGSFRRQRVVLDADLNATHNALEARKRRG